MNLPDGTVHIEIDGGCHSYFGSYGLQKGDGKPEITVSEQTEKTAQAIIEMISN